MSSIPQKSEKVKRRKKVKETLKHKDKKDEEDKSTDQGEEETDSQGEEEGEKEVARKTKTEPKNSGIKKDTTKGTIDAKDRNIKKEKEEKNSQETNETGRKTYWIYIITLLILLAAIALVQHPVAYDVVFSKKHSYLSIEKYIASIGEMKADFPNQYQLYWNLLRNSGKRHLGKVFGQKTDDLRPLSFLVVSYAESENILDCFLQRLGESYTDKPFTKIDSGRFNGSDVEEGRQLLDDEIKENLKHEQKFVIVNNIERLSFRAAQLFMTYADEHNDVNDYPQSTIFMSAVLPFPSTNDRRRDESRVGTFFQTDVWGTQSTVDSKAALWTRVGDGIIVLREEKTNPC